MTGIKQQSFLVACPLVLLATAVIVGEARSTQPRSSPEAPPPAQAGFQIVWYTVDAGGGTSPEGDSNFALTGTVGQVDAGKLDSNEHAFAVRGGFWPVSDVSALACPADIDRDGIVGFSDLVEVLSNWGPCPGCPSDIDGDGVVGFGDLVLVQCNLIVDCQG